LVFVPLSDSFRATCEDVARELSCAVTDWRPDEGKLVPAGATAVWILAGGEEPAAVDLLGDFEALPCPVFVVAAATDHRLATAALQRGAEDYFALPGDLDVLRRSLDRVCQAQHSRSAAERFAAEERSRAGFAAIVGESDSLRRVVEQAARVAPFGEVTVHIEGETGTGKELLARAIHYHSPRASAPFVDINCAAIPASLLESELFGHERGSFTGAIAAKPGLFEQAHGGTLFLDEIGHMPLELQAKLLRALESKEIRRVGGRHLRPVDVRVIAATHVNLVEAIQQGEFREDLYYRLNVVRLTLPPLRERPGDIDRLAETFLSHLAARHAVPVPAIGPDTRDALRAHPWPGNVRELRNALERALILSPPGTLSVHELRLAPEAAPTDSATPIPFPAPLEKIIRAAVAAMLELTQGNKSEAARLLGISRPRLQRWLDGRDHEPTTRV